VKRRVVRNKDCTWSQIELDCDTWSASCGNEFTINDGTPRDNNLKFCCFCGGVLHQRTARRPRAVLAIGDGKP
jgi:hypothetical protein